MKKHGYKYTRIYNIWGLMKNRCYCPTSNNYKNYGGRGIKICDEWKNNFIAFKDWAYANGYNEKLTIDRIDNNGNYEPSNCRWITNLEQQFNKRNNHLITYNGKTQTLSQWAKELEISREVIEQRLKRKLPIEKVLTKGYLKDKKIKPIMQYDKEGNIIKIWNCYAAQIQKETGICSRNILYCLNHKQKTCKGYVWRYANDISD